jgi:hypothetical protein
MTSMHIGRLLVELDGTRLVLSGRIDESAVLGTLVPQIASGDVTINTSGVTFINSIGMREWMRLVRALRDRGSKVILDRVADVIMTQMNMISDLAAHVKVLSFHAQYLCTRCGAEGTPLVDAIAHAQDLRELRAPRLQCTECDGTMELADFPERYLSIFRS